MLSLLVALALDASSLPSLDAWMSQRGYRLARIDDAVKPWSIDYQTPPHPMGEPSELFSAVSVAYETYDLLQARTFSSRRESLSDSDGRFEAPGDVAYEHKSLSGLPLGTDVWATRANRAFKLRVRTPWMRADVSLMPYKTFPAHPEEVVEGAARQVVGLAEARRLLVSTRRTLSGTILPAYQTDAALSFGDLSAWSALRGWTAKVDDDHQLETLTKGTHTLVMPLGAQALKVDGIWKDLPDVIMLKEGKWWVPLDGLEAATAGL